MYSSKALEWLKWMEHSSDRRIQHTQSPGGEQYLDDVHRWADGYHSDSKTVYLFHGCYYHGHITHLSPSTENKKLCSSMGDLYRETKRVEALIQHAGSVNGLKISTMLKISVYLLGSSIGLILYYLDLLSMVVVQMFFLFTRKQTT